MICFTFRPNANGVAEDAGSEPWIARMPLELRAKERERNNFPISRRALAPVWMTSGGYCAPVPKPLAVKTETFTATVLQPSAYARESLPILT